MKTKSRLDEIFKHYSYLFDIKEVWYYSDPKTTKHITKLAKEKTYIKFHDFVIEKNVPDTEQAICKR